VASRDAIPFTIDEHDLEQMTEQFAANFQVSG